MPVTGTSKVLGVSRRVSRQVRFKSEVAAIVLSSAVLLAMPVQAQLIVDGGATHDTVGNETFTTVVVGETGQGTLNIGTGTSVTVTGAGNPVVVLGNTGTGVGTVNVSGGQLTVVNNNTLRLGNLGNASMNVTNGGTVDVYTIIMGYNNAVIGPNPNPDLIANLVVSGAGSRVDARYQISVSNGIAANLTITDHAAVTAASYMIVGNNNSRGSLTVDNGGTLTVGGDLSIGNSGVGMVNIGSGGTVTAGPFGGVGVGNNATGELNVSGPGAVLNANGANTMTVGNNNTGKLTISGGGLVDVTQSALVYIGRGTGSGSATVSGAGSLWRMAGNLAVGYQSSGSLTLSDGGRAVIGSGIGILTLGTNAAGSGTLNIGAAAGDAAQAPGILESASVQAGAGSGRIVFNHMAAAGDGYVFSAAVSGAVTVDSYSGVTTLAAANTYTGATTVYGGILKAGIANAFSAASVHNVQPGASLDLGGYDQTITDLSNGGSILTNGSGATRLTVQNYIGNGGALLLNTVLGGDSSPSDRLIITGSATGNSFLQIANIGGSGALTTGNGILVVEAVGGAVTDTGAFQLSGRAAAGAYEYTLYRGGDVTPENWYLRSTLALPSEPSQPSDGGQEVPNYRVEVPLIAALTPIALEYGYSILGTYHERTGGIRFATPMPIQEDRTVRLGNGRKALAKQSATIAEGNGGYRIFEGAWARMFGDRGFRNAGNFERHGPDYSYNFTGIQAGFDLFGMDHGGGVRDKAGIYVGYGRIDADEKGAWYGEAGSSDMDAYTVGAYWTRTGSSGWYTDAVIQGTWYDASAHSVGGQRFDLEGFGVLASLEGGYAFDLGNGFRIEPQAQLVYQNVSFDNVADAYGRFDLSTGESLRGRVGLRLSKAWDVPGMEKPRPIETWLRVNVWHEFMGDSTMHVSALSGLGPVAIRSKLEGTWGEIGAGISGRITDNVALFATGAYNHSLDNDGRETWNGRIGVSVKW